MTCTHFLSNYMGKKLFFFRFFLHEVIMYNSEGNGVGITSLVFRIVLLMFVKSHDQNSKLKSSPQIQISSTHPRQREVYTSVCVYRQRGLMTQQTSCCMTHDTIH